MTYEIILKRLMDKGYNRRNAIFQAHIDIVTLGGKLGEEAFTLVPQQSIEALLPPDDGTQEMALARHDIRRLYKEPIFRRDFVTAHTLFTPQLIYA